MFQVAVVFPVDCNFSSDELRALNGYTLEVTNNMLHFRKKNVSLADIPQLPERHVIVTDEKFVMMSNYCGDGWKPAIENKIIPELFSNQVW